MIPSICEFRFDRRLLPEEPIELAEKELRKFFQKAVEKTGCKASLEITNRQQGYHTPKNSFFVETVSESIKKTVDQSLPFAAELGGNDGSFFAKMEFRWYAMERLGLTRVIMMWMNSCILKT